MTYILGNYKGKTVLCGAAVTRTRAFLKEGYTYMFIGGMRLGIFVLRFNKASNPLLCVSVPRRHGGTQSQHTVVSPD